MTQADTRPRTPAPVEPAPRPPARTTSGALAWAERLALPALLVVAIVVFSALHPTTFASAGNFRVIISAQAVTAVIALAMMIPLLSGRLDVSVGSVAVLSSIITASLTTQSGWPFPAALVAVLLLGMVIGLVNGFLVTRFGIDSLIVTLAGSFIITGLISWYTSDNTIAGENPAIVTALGVETLAGIPWLAIVAALIALVIAYVLTQTPFGRRIVAIGSSGDAATLVGIRLDRTVCVTFVISGGVSALAGVLLLAQVGTGNPSTDGLGMTLPAIAAVFLGASTITPGRFNVLGTVIGLLLVAVFVSGLTLSGAQAWIQAVFQGGALIVGVGASAALRRRRMRGRA